MNPATYYTRRRRRLLAQFDWATRTVRPLFDARYGARAGDALIAEARAEYALLIPALPYVGGRQPLTQFVIASGWFLAMVRVLQRRGETIEQAGPLVYASTAAFIEKMPRFTRRLLGHVSFSPRYLRRLRQRASESQAHPTPDGYVLAFVEGDGATFDYGVDYLQCATTQFLQAQGAGELAPYLCTVDRLYSEAFGWGLTRTQTLAEGYPRCDFRFKRGGPTRVTSVVMGWK